MVTNKPESQKARTQVGGGLVVISILTVPNQIASPRSSPIYM